jgi:hypothetical protein
VWVVVMVVRRPHMWLFCLGGGKFLVLWRCLWTCCYSGVGVPLLWAVSSKHCNYSGWSVCATDEEGGLEAISRRATGDRDLSTRVLSGRIFWICQLVDLCPNFARGPGVK